MFNWQFWIQKFIDSPSYNDTRAVISEAAKPLYKVLGMHRLNPNEDEAKQVIYIDVLGIDNKRKPGAKIEYNSELDDPISISVNEFSDEIASFSFPGDKNVNVWHPDGEGAFGLKSGYSYLVVFRENDKPVNLGGILVTVSQDYIASLKPDSQGNVTFFVDIKQ